MQKTLVAAFHRRVSVASRAAAGVVDAAVGRADFTTVHVVAHRDTAALWYSHWLQGSPVGLMHQMQFSALAKIRAMVELPHAPGPVSR